MNNKDKRLTVGDKVRFIDKFEIDWDDVYLYIPVGTEGVITDIDDNFIGVQTNTRYGEVFVFDDILELV